MEGRIHRLTPRKHDREGEEAYKLRAVSRRDANARNSENIPFFLLVAGPFADSSLHLEGNVRIVDLIGIPAEQVIDLTIVIAGLPHPKRRYFSKNDGPHLIQNSLCAAKHEKLKGLHVNLKKFYFATGRENSPKKIVGGHHIHFFAAMVEKWFSSFLADPEGTEVIRLRIVDWPESQAARFRSQLRNAPV